MTSEQSRNPDLHSEANRLIDLGSQKLMQEPLFLEALGKSLFDRSNRRVNGEKYIKDGFEINVKFDLDLRDSTGWNSGISFTVTKTNMETRGKKIASINLFGIGPVSISFRIDDHSEAQIENFSGVAASIKIEEFFAEL